MTHLQSLCETLNVYLLRLMDNPPLFISYLFPSSSFSSLVYLAFSQTFVLFLSSLYSSSLISINTRSATPPPHDEPTDSHFGNARHYSPFIGFADFSLASRDARAMHHDVSRQRPRICNNSSDMADRYKTRGGGINPLRPFPRRCAGRKKTDNGFQTRAAADTSRQSLAFEKCFLHQSPDVSYVLTVLLLN